MKMANMKNRVVLFGAAIASSMLVLSGGVPAAEKTETKTSSAVSITASAESVTEPMASMTSSADSFAAAAAEAAALPDGEYDVTFKTDGSMFRINEALHDTARLTVKDGEMTVHITLVSKNILNLFPGLAEDAVKDGAVLLEPTEDEVTYSDGMTETVYGFDVPVPALDEEFDLALIGKKGKWYDHKVTVSAPDPKGE